MSNLGKSIAVYGWSRKDPGRGLSVYGWDVGTGTVVLPTRPDRDEDEVVGGSGGKRRRKIYQPEVFSRKDDTLAIATALMCAVGEEDDWEDWF